MARVEELAQRARKAEAAGFHLGSNPGSPGPGSARSARSARSDRSSQRYRVQSPRSPDPNAPVNADWYDENGQLRPTTTHRNGDDPFSDRQSVSTTGTDARSDHVIPIKYMPRAPSDEALSKTLRAKPAAADAAKALDEARNNLFKHGAAPMRPARSPDLDLRLNPSAQQGHAQQHLGPPSSFQDIRSPSQSGTSGYRDSYLSGNSGAPSYLSGSTDIHLDAPKIVTSRQVQIGRLQQAEVVQFGRPPQAHNMENLDHAAPPSPSASSSHTNPFGRSDDSHLHPPAPLSPATFGSRTLGSDVSGAASGSPSYRTLTPVSYRTHGAEEDLRTEEAPSTSTDLRFSMGSLAQTARNSVSTMGTERYFAQAVPPPRQGANGNYQGPRESMASSRSAADSVLHGFPMIPPGQSNAPYHSPIPQSTSVTTLEHAAMPSRPPTSYRQTQTPGPGTGSGGNRNTQGSVGLGNFPFVPPPRRGSDDSKMSRDQEQELPSAALPTGVATDGPPTLPHPTRGRNTMGMSTTSEGLGGFEFSFDGAPPVPDSK